MAQGYTANSWLCLCTLQQESACQGTPLPPTGCIITMWAYYLPYFPLLSLPSRALTSLSPSLFGETTPPTLEELSTVPLQGLKVFA